MPQLCAQATIATSHHWTKADDPAVLCAHCLSWSVNFICHLQKCKTNAVFFYLHFFFQNGSLFSHHVTDQLYRQTKIGFLSIFNYKPRERVCILFTSKSKYIFMLQEDSGFKSQPENTFIQTSLWELNYEQKVFGR